MKHRILALLAVALGLLVVTANQVQAQIPAKVNLSATVYIEGDDYKLGDIYIQEMVKVRINTKTLLVLFAEALGRDDFPRGSYLLATPDDDSLEVTVVTPTGESTVVTPYFMIEPGEDFFLEQEKRNMVTFQASSREIFPMTVTIGTDAIAKFVVSGLAFVSSKSGAADDNDMQRMSFSLTENVAGIGTVRFDEDDPQMEPRQAALVGRLTARGKGMELVND